MFGRNNIVTISDRKISTRFGRITDCILRTKFINADVRCVYWTKYNLKNIYPHALRLEIFVFLFTRFFGRFREVSEISITRAFYFYDYIQVNRETKNLTCTRIHDACVEGRLIILYTSSCVLVVISFRFNETGSDASVYHELASKLWNNPTAAVPIINLIHNHVPHIQIWS